jgi:hypothetical protein
MNKISHSTELNFLFKDLVLSADIMQSDLMNQIILEVYNGWPGKVGEERVINVVTLINHRVPQYAAVMLKTELETLELFANSRDVNFTNYFQDANFPDLSGVYVFDTVTAFKNKFPSGKYQCPRCGGTSTDYQVCNSGQIMDKKSKQVCDWKVYGLFGDLGKGIRVIIKEKFTDFPKPVSMFKPLELIK